MQNLQISISELLKKLSEINIQVFHYGDDLEIKSKKPLTNEQRFFFRQNKISFLKFFQSTETKILSKPDYFGMSPHPVTNPERLKQYWSILGDCIDDRKGFYFQCENEQEADELKKLTWTLVFQLNDRWRVDLDGLALKAEPPPEKETTSSKIKLDESE